MALANYSSANIAYHLKHTHLFVAINLASWLQKEHKRLKRLPLVDNQHLWDCQTWKISPNSRMGRHHVTSRCPWMGNPKCVSDLRTRIRLMPPPLAKASHQKMKNLRICQKFLSMKSYPFCSRCMLKKLTSSYRNGCGSTFFPTETHQLKASVEEILFSHYHEAVCHIQHAAVD